LTDSIENHTDLEVNSAQNVWQYLNPDYFSKGVFNGYAAIFGAACDAWDGLIDLTKTITLFGMKGQARIKTAKNCNCLRDAPDNLMSTAT